MNFSFKAFLNLHFGYAVDGCVISGTYFHALNLPDKLKEYMSKTRYSKVTKW